MSDNREKDRVRAAVLISGGGTNLQAMIDKRDTGELQYAELALTVSSNANAGGLERAKKAGIPAVYIPEENFEGQLEQLLFEKEIDIIVLAGFIRILSKDFVKKHENRIINVHPSLIPSFCGDGFYGLKVHEAALKYGVKITGATVHFVNEITDGGKIIAQKAVEVHDGDTPETLQRRVMREAEWIILPAALEKVAKELTAQE